MNLKNFIVYSDDSVNECLKKIEYNKKGFVLVCEKNNKLIGVVTDGDIRRKLLISQNLNEGILSICNTEFTYAKSNFSHESIYKLLDNKIKFIPILNNKNILVDIIDKDSIPERRENKICARSKSPVRISFGGGGSDTTNYFYENGGAVLNASISIYSHCSLEKRKDKKIIINSYDLQLKCEYNNLNHLKTSVDNLKLIRALINVINPKFGFELFIQSDFPIGSGLGGSAAVLSSILGCFNELRIDKWNQYEISEIAYEAERLNLGVSGGWQDQYATVFGGINFMEFKQNENLIHSIKIPNEILFEFENNLILCYTNSDHGNKNIHDDQKINSKKLDTKKLIKKNVLLVYQMRKLLLKGNLKNFGKLLNDAWQLKKSFSSLISNKYLNEIYDNALKNGALGGKLLGAGGGGYFLFYTNNSKRNELISWIDGFKNISYTPFKFDQHGMASWKVRT
jgi:D-glycero-alpha-D-manno-heptose-7-phosphate kinase